MSKVISSDGTAIAFDRAGDGPPVILVDGALCHRGFGPAKPLAQRLVPHFTVVTYDRRGRGESGDTRPYSVEREVDDIEALVKEAGGSAHLYGISSGAALALEAATRLSNVEKLALYEAPFVVDDTTPPRPDDLVAHMDALIAADRRSEALRLFMRIVGTPAFFILIAARARRGCATPCGSSPTYCPTRGTGPCPARPTCSSRTRSPRSWWSSSALRKGYLAAARPSGRREPSAQPGRLCG